MPLDAPDLDRLADALRLSRGLAHKQDIGPVLRQLGVALSPGGAGDDCAAIPDGDGHLLFAIEGFLNEFVVADPFFAGWCGVMVNASDIAAMGGRSLAVVDAVWSDGPALAGRVLDGLRAAAASYAIPIRGGHTNLRAGGGQLAVAILGRAGPDLLTSFDASPGDDLVAAIDLRGRMRHPSPWWDASSDSPAERLRDDLAILPALAEDGLCRAAKDISMGGVIGTATMLADTSGIGCEIDPMAVPRPPDIDLALWLGAFPSYGFLLATSPSRTDAVLARFAARGIASARIGVCDRSRLIRLTSPGLGDVTIRDLARSPLLG